jgi:cysteine desulfurase/selenocysteine lyase
VLRVPEDGVFDVACVRADFPILRTIVRGKPLVYLDNAATTQKPLSVITAESRFYAAQNSNIHRGVYQLPRILNESSRF